MLLTITVNDKNAESLGYMLHKHPDNFQTFGISYGDCHVFYPEVESEKATVALLLDIDPVKLVRGGSRSNNDAPLAQYVNDRPYVASSLMSVAMSKVFRTAMNGQCKERPELPDLKMSLEAEISTTPVKGGDAVLRKLFEPLGYEVTATRLPLDDKFPEWGDSKLFNFKIKAVTRLKDLLNHLYVLIPVLDSAKHYFVGQDEIEKLLRRGEDWLATHPAKDFIARRYLRNKKSLATIALERLVTEEQLDSDDEIIEISAEVTKADAKPTVLSQNREDILEEKISLNQKRMVTVVEKLKELGIKKVIDLGCGEGKLLRLLLEDFFFTQIVGTDVSIRSLEIANRRLRIDRLPERRRAQIELFQGSLMYRDSRFCGFDGVTCIEVIEHLDLPRLKAFEKIVFSSTKPPVVIITTPNREYNQLFEGMKPGQLRHNDHRFEWTREEFSGWADKICKLYGYSHNIYPVGDVDENHGAPTQMGVFTYGN